MKDKSERNIKKYIVILIIVIVCFLYLGSAITYTAYESNITGTVNNDVGKFKIYINNVDVTATDDSGKVKDVLLNGITWNATHTREGKMAPGASGVMRLNLDPHESDVEIKYDFTFIDKQIDSDKLLTFSSIVSNNGNLIKTGPSTFTGIVTLDDINNNKVINIDIAFSFENLGDMEAITEDNGNLEDFFSIDFHAVQYNGETITPYTG